MLEINMYKGADKGVCPGSRNQPLYRVQRFLQHLLHFIITLLSIFFSPYFTPLHWSFRCGVLSAHSVPVDSTRHLESSRRPLVLWRNLTNFPFLRYCSFDACFWDAHGIPLLLSAHAFQKLRVINACPRFFENSPNTR